MAATQQPNPEADIAAYLQSIKDNEATILQFGLVDVPSLSDETICSLSALLPANTSISDVDLAFIHREIGAQALKTLCENLSKNKSIENVTVSGDYVHTELAIVDALLASQSAKFTRIEISYVSKFDDDCWKKLGQSLKQHPKTSLSHLSISGTGIGHVGYAAICEGLEQIAAFTNIEIQENELTAQSAQSLAQLLGSNKNISSLVLAETPLTVDSVKALFSTGQASKLKTISLSECCLDDACVQIIANAVASSATIGNLDLGKNKLTQAAINELAAALQKNKSLDSLEISDFKDDIGNVDYSGILQALIGQGKSAKLLSISLGNGSISNKKELAQLAALTADLFAINPTFTQLVLDYDVFADQDVFATFQAAIKAKKELSQVEVSALEGRRSCVQVLRNH